MDGITWEMVMRGEHGGFLRLMRVFTCYTVAVQEGVRQVDKEPWNRAGLGDMKGLSPDIPLIY